MKKLIIIVALILVSVTVNLMAQTNWKFDLSHSTVGFNVTHMVISSVDGKFTKYDGTVTTNGDDLTGAKISFNIDVNSINTSNDKRDAHLKSDDFFNAEKFPKITFVSKSIKKTGNNKYKMKGDFTIRDVTKEIELDVVHTGSVKDSWGNFRSAYKITGTINRFDFGLKWNNLLETGGAVVSKEVDIICNIQLIKS